MRPFELTMSVMNRLKRRWPALLIGVALVAVIVVSLTTLLGRRPLVSPVQRDGRPAVPNPQKHKRLPPTPVHVRRFGSKTKAVDQFKRSWPDLLIGVALVCVIAMIAATLISGTSLVSMVRRDAPTDAPVTNTTDTTELTSDPTGTAATPAAVTTGTGAEQTPNSSDVFVSDVPSQPAASVARGAETDSGSLGAATPRAGTQRSGSVAEATKPPSAVSAASGFRVAAGASPSRDAASTLAQNYRDDGYKVVVEQQDDLYLLWVGPFATLADADSAAERIIADGGDALIYTYGDDRDADATGVVDAATPEDSATEEAVAQLRVPDSEDRHADGSNEVATTAANAGSGTIAVGAANAGTVGIEKRYLQVGAFAVDGSDRPLRAQLEALGLSITRDEDTSGLVRLYVGPFGGAQLTRTRSRLSAQGIDSFPVDP